METGRPPGPLDSIYKVEKELGKGAFGIVRLGRVRITGAKRAIKTISKEMMKDRPGSPAVPFCPFCWVTVNLTLNPKP